MKVIVSESTLGPDYLGDVVVSCDRTEIKFPGSDEVFHMECIVDDANGEIYYYEPKLARYATDKLLHGNDLDIWEVLKNPDLINVVFLDAHGDEFKQFAVKWNALQKKTEDDEVYKTQICRPIMGNFTEGNQIDSAIVYWKDSRIKPYIISQVHSLIEALYVLDGMRDSEPEGDFPEVDHIRVGNKDYDQDAIEKYRADLDDMVYDEYDESMDSSNVFAEGEDDIVRKIPNWATTYIIYGDVSDNLTDEDIKLVDDYLDKLASRGISLISPIDGTESEFEPHPAFGDACDTTDWSCEKTTSID